MNKKRIDQAIAKIAELKGEAFGSAVKESFGYNSKVFPRNPIWALHSALMDQFVYGVDSTDADRQASAIIKQCLPRTGLQLAWRVFRQYLFRDEEYYPG